MPLPKIEEARKMNNEELADAILSAKRELFNLRLQQATRRLEKPHQFKHLRHRIAQMMTVIREREIAEAKSAQASPEPSEAPASASPQASTEDRVQTPQSNEQEEE
jgi:large subunit ribosomal protein L29